MRRVPAVAIAALALAIAWAFVATVLRHTRPMGLPLDDSYIYLTYARQLARGQPFTYFPGGGYSAGATSALWPIVLSPLWALGARGHALVWAVVAVSTALYVATALGVYRVVRHVVGELAGVLAAVIVLAIAPFAWTALSGMEVALASALVITVIRLLLTAPPTGRPGWRLAACLAAAALARPEAGLLVIAIVGVAAVQRLRQRDLGACAAWLVPLAAPAAWLCANRVGAGSWLPNTAIAKSHFYLPGFDWSYWRDAVATQGSRMLRGLFWDAASPLVWPRLIAALWLVGAARVIGWARRADRRLAGALIVGAPGAWLLAVIAASGQWEFQNYRYIAPAFPLLAIAAGAALGPRPAARWARGHAVAAAAIVVGLAVAALPGLAADAALFAQSTIDTNAHVVAIGEYVQRRLPDAELMLHDAGAIAYYSDRPVRDMIGLVTNHQAEIANHGPGARFELLEALPPDRRFTHYAYNPAWLGTSELFGDVALHTFRPAGAVGRRVVGDADMQLIAASWDHVGTGERPLLDHAGWAIVDRLDVADLASEAAHGWTGALGPRRLGDPTARWSVVGREVGAHGLVLDGGRTIRGGGERFTITRDPARPVRLVLRTGGARSYAFHEAIDRDVALRLLDDAGRELARAIVPAPVPDGRFLEVVLELPPGAPAALRTDAPAPYRAFHWFVLQPE